MRNCISSLKVSGVGGGGGGRATCNSSRFWVGMYLSRTKKYTYNLGKSYIEKKTKTYKNYMNLLIFLDLSYNLCKNFKFSSLQWQNVQHLQIFLFFAFDQGKILLIQPITWAVQMYTWSSLEVPPSQDYVK